MTIQLLLLFLVAYLFGAIPSSVWFGKIFYKKDVRQYGSGNAGATNTFRVLGRTAGIIVLALDIGKGCVAVLLAQFLQNQIGPSNMVYYQIGFGLSAALGHIYPVYLRFRGGKGVATFFGVALIIFPVAALLCVAAFAITFAISKFVSLGSILASFVFMITILTTDARAEKWPVVFFAVAVPFIIIYTHRQNIRRLINGTESKMSLGKK